VCCLGGKKRFPLSLQSLDRSFFGRSVGLSIDPIQPVEKLTVQILIIPEATATEEVTAHKPYLVLHLTFSLRTAG
jgi:hypothetical protein